MNTKDEIVIDSVSALNKHKNQYDPTSNEILSLPCIQVLDLLSYSYFTITAINSKVAAFL